MMLIPVIAMLIADPREPDFPEQVPGLVEACLESAVATNSVTETDDSQKYICAGDTAARLWKFLERAKIKSYEQDTPDEGRWLGRDFPLGACFKQIRRPDGMAGGNGLSCTIWVPRPIVGAADKS
ncbi:MAG: hypothetical protein ACTHJR_04915 [Sphingomonas sp.]|uniref:hypothetical protein n=1 Tax=Sphingomonas sp. TaxID=28214 RepID=UPI003F806DE6